MKKILFITILMCLSLTAGAQTVTWRDSVVVRLDSVLCDELLERSQLGLMVWDLTDDTLLYQYQPRQLLRTASTMKALTAVVALDHLGVDYKFRTSLYYTGKIDNGVLTGNLVCVGGMDPMFDSSDMKAFVAAVSQLGIKSIRGRVMTDCSMKDTDKWGEGWCWDDDNPTLSPLLSERKTNFTQQLVSELKRSNISISSGSPLPGNLPKDAKQICVRTHSIDEVLEQMMKQSDNLYAESMFYQIAASTGKRPSKAKDAISVVKSFLRKISLDSDHYKLADGSGLSLYDYLTAECETQVMRYAWQHQDVFAHLYPSLTIAGIDGTLKGRMKGTCAENNVRAKTGSVTAVSTLTGYLTASNGHFICFAIMNQGVRKMSEGRQMQDRICTVLCSPCNIPLQTIWNLLKSNQ